MHPALKKTAYRLAQSDILFWTLPGIMILLIIGTIAQKDLGLYAAQHTYFSSFLTFIGPVPFPGGYTLMSILFINLLMKFLFFSDWHWRKAGIILSHFGVLLLLGGGFVTAASEQEGYMVVAEGETSKTIEDYQQRVMTVTQNGKNIFRIPFEDLSAGSQIGAKAFPFSIHIDETCLNCKIERRLNADDQWRGPGRFMDLQNAPLEKNYEANLTGIEFAVTGTNADGRYLTFDKFPKPPQFKIGENTYAVIIGRAERDLPFAVTLQKFAAEFYPGTQDAKSYRSDIRIDDGTKSWTSKIEMNAPLRYKGFTLYQSSFDMAGDRRFTVLNVVENKGRLFPYISCFFIALGTALHLALRLRKAATA